MTITRLWQAGAEFDEELVEFTSTSNSAFQTSSTKARTGTYSFRTASYRYATQVLDTTYTQLRLGGFVNHAGVFSSTDPSIFQLLSGSTIVVDLRWDGGTSTLELYVGASLEDSALSANFANTDTWMHVGIDCKIAGSGGWVTVYLDGNEVLSYSGDTTAGASSIDTIIVGNTRGSDSWSNYIYYDDLYIDNTSGEGSAAVVPDYRFEPVIPNGNGNSSDWDGSDGNSTDNYELVDETPPDGDTSYVETDIGGEEDDYTMSNISLPSGYEISAVIPMAYAKKLNAGGSLELKLATRAVISATTYYVSSAAFALGTDYGLIWERRTQHPNSGAWDETIVNTLEVGVIAD